MSVILRNLQDRGEAPAPQVQPDGAPPCRQPTQAAARLALISSHTHPAQRRSSARFTRPLLRIWVSWVSSSLFRGMASAGNFLVLWVLRPASTCFHLRGRRGTFCTSTAEEHPPHTHAHKHTLTHSHTHALMHKHIRPPPAARCLLRRASQARVHCRSPSASRRPGVRPRRRRPRPTPFVTAKRPPLREEGSSERVPTRRVATCTRGQRSPHGRQRQHAARGCWSTRPPSTAPWGLCRGQRRS